MLKFYKKMCYNELCLHIFQMLSYSHASLVVQYTLTQMWRGHPLACHIESERELYVLSDQPQLWSKQVKIYIFYINYIIIHFYSPFLTMWHFLIQYLVISNYLDWIKLYVYITNKAPYRWDQEDTVPGHWLTAICCGKSTAS